MSAYLVEGGSALAFSSTEEPDENDPPSFHPQVLLGVSSVRTLFETFHFARGNPLP